MLDKAVVLVEGPELYGMDVFPHALGFAARVRGQVVVSDSVIEQGAYRSVHPVEIAVCISCCNLDILPCPQCRYRTELGKSYQGCPAVFPEKPVPIPWPHAGA